MTFPAAYEVGNGFPASAASSEIDPSRILPHQR